MAVSSWTSTWPFPLFFFFTTCCSTSLYQHTHKYTHVQTGPWGVFSPEVAICTCLFGMQWALPRIPVMPIPVSCLWLSLLPLSIHFCVYVYLYACMIMFSLVCVDVCISMCVHIFCKFVCCCKIDLEYGADFLVASRTNPSVLGDQLLCTTASLS